MLALTIGLTKEGGLTIVTAPTGDLEPRLSSSGRSWVLASTEGAIDLRPMLSAKLGLEGPPVMLEVNLYMARGQNEGSRVGV